MGIFGVNKPLHWFIALGVLCLLDVLSFVAFHCIDFLGNIFGLILLVLTVFGISRLLFNKMNYHDFGFLFLCLFLIITIIGIVFVIVKNKKK